MTPAEELRTAAKLMRERVQGATAGPWTVREEHGRDIADEGWSDVRVVRPGAGVAITYLSNVLEGSPHEDNAAYIASMHPGVALAVADWLARFADPVYCYGPPISISGTRWTWPGGLSSTATPPTTRPRP